MIRLVLDCVFVIVALALASKAEGDIIKLKSIDNIEVKYGEELTIYLDEYFAGESLTYEVISWTNTTD